MQVKRLETLTPGSSTTELVTYELASAKVFLYSLH